MEQMQSIVNLKLCVSVYTFDSEVKENISYRVLSASVSVESLYLYLARVHKVMSSLWTTKV